MRITIEILQKKTKESNYNTLLDQGQLAACVFTHWWWSNGQKKFITMILRGFRTDLLPKLCLGTVLYIHGTKKNGRELGNNCLSREDDYEYFGCAVKT